MFHITMVLNMFLISTQLQQAAITGGSAGAWVNNRASESLGKSQCVSVLGSFRTLLLCGMLSTPISTDDDHPTLS